MPLLLNPKATKESTNYADVDGSMNRSMYQHRKHRYFLQLGYHTSYSPDYINTYNNNNKCI